MPAFRKHPREIQRIEKARSDTYNPCDTHHPMYHWVLGVLPLVLPLVLPIGE